MKVFIKHIPSISLLLFLTVLSTSFYVFIQSFSSNFFAFSNQDIYGESLGITSETYEVKLQDTEEAKYAYQKFCRTYPDCTILQFCKHFSQLCIFPTKTESSTIETQPTVAEVKLEPVKITPVPQTQTETEVQDQDVSAWCYWTRKFQLGDCNPTPSPSKAPTERLKISTPTPTTKSTDTTNTESNAAAVQIVPKSWCYDTDGENLDTRGVCRDATGTYYDECNGAQINEYICQGSWTGTEYTNQKCTTKRMTCNKDNSCQVGRCLVVTEAKEQKIETVSEESKKITATPQNTKESAHEVTPVPKDQAKTVAIESPSIISPTSGSIIAGIIQLQVDTKLFSTVTLLLQPSNSVQDRIHIGRVQTSQKTVDWDSSLLPNGDYFLYAIAHRVADKYISQPIAITIKNDNSVAGHVQDVILPSDFKPEKVPIDKRISISTVETQVKEAAQSIVLEGRAEPNSIVSLLIYSNPIVVTVRTDANGVWTYILEEPLEPGNHTAYVVVPQEDGSQIRSDINTFFVPPVYASSVGNQTLQSGEVTESKMIRNFIILAAILVLDAIAILLFVYRLKNNSRK